MCRIICKLPILIAVTVWITPLLSAQNQSGETGARTLYLIRHGDYDHQDSRDPRIGRALVPLGVAQAKLTGDRLRALRSPVSSLVGSTMTRARETAQIIGQSLPDLALELDPLLEECTPPTWRVDIMADTTEEEADSCRRRLDEAWAKYFRPSPAGAKSQVLVAHGNVIRYFVTRALGVDPKAWLGMSIANCSLTEIVVGPDGDKKVLSFSDAGHIPPNLRSRTAPGEPITLEVPGRQNTGVSETVPAGVKMDESNQVPVLRIARPTDQLSALREQYVSGLGFEVLGQFADHEGFDGAILGHPRFPYHLEFTSKKGHIVGRSPSEDHLLVFYLPNEEQWSSLAEKMLAAGFRHVDSFNPYWDRKGRTFQDLDGYRVVLQNADWSR